MENGSAQNAPLLIVKHNKRQRQQVLTRAVLIVLNVQSLQLDGIFGDF
jgi:hypothetical protein